MWYNQYWHLDFEKTSNTNLYKKIKHYYFGISHAIHLLDTNSCKILIAFLTRNHRWPIETGRRDPRSIKNMYFSCNFTGNEYQYLIKCPVLIKREHTICVHIFYQRPNRYTLFELWQYTNVPTIRQLSVFWLFDYATV